MRMDADSWMNWVNDAAWTMNKLLTHSNDLVARAKAKELIAIVETEEREEPKDHIKAWAHSDDHVFEAQFNAAPWFKQATDDDLLALAREGFGYDYKADEIARWESEDNPEVAAIFIYLEKLAGTRRSQGFECRVDRTDAMAWIAKHRPALHEKIVKEEEGV